MAIRISKKKRKERGQYFTHQFDVAETDRKALIEKIEKVRDYYYREPGGFTANEPWEGAADIHLPVIMDKVETATPKVVSALWRADPFVNVRPPGGGGSDLATRNVERFSSWAFRNDIPDCYLTLENFVRNMFTDGTAIGKIGWKRKWRHTIDVNTVKRFYEEGDTDVFGEPVELDREKTPQEVFAEIFGFGSIERGVISDKKVGDHYIVQFVEAGRKETAKVYLEDSDVLDEITVRAFRRVLDQDSPSFDLVDLEHFLIPFRAKSIESASWVAQRTWYTMADVKQRVRDGDWSLTKAEMNALAAHKRAYDEESEVDRTKDTVIGEGAAPGVAQSTDDERIDPNKVEIWEVYCRDYVEEAGETMDVVYFVSEDLDMVVGAEYHDDLFPHGKRPFVSATYIPVPNRFYGISMAEILYAINTEVDHTISTVHNLTELVVNPFYFYTPFAMTASGKLAQKLKPGEGIKVADVNGIRFPEWNQQPLQLFHASFNTLLGYADGLTFSGGIAGNNNYRNAPRTARATMYLGEQAEEKLSSIVEQLQATAWKSLVTQVVALYGRYVSADKWYHVTGETSPRRISARDLRQNYMYEFSGTLTSVNREMQRALAQQRYMAARTDPLYQSDMDASRMLLRDFLKHMSEGDEFESMLPSPPGQGGFSHPPMRQEDEIEVMAVGQAVEILPSDDHEKHLAVIDKFRESDAFEHLDQVSVALIASHYRAHLVAKQEAALRQQRAMELGQTPMPGGNAPPAQAAPQPGIPQEGNPAIGGELSAVEGGPV